MKRNVWAAITLAAAVFISACSGAPSGADVIKAVSQSDFFTGGHGHTLQEPIIIIERGKRNNEGTWPIKVKMKFTFRKNDGSESAAMVSSPLFNLRKVKDATGKVEWKAVLGS